MKQFLVSGTTLQQNFISIFTAPKITMDFSKIKPTSLKCHFSWEPWLSAKCHRNKNWKSIFDCCKPEIRFRKGPSKERGTKRCKVDPPLWIIHGSKFFSGLLSKVFHACVRQLFLQNYGLVLNIKHWIDSKVATTSSISNSPFYLSLKFQS